MYILCIHAHCMKWNIRALLLKRMIRQGGAGAPAEELESRVLRRDARQGSREAPRRTPDAVAVKARHTACPGQAQHALVHVLI